MTALFCVVYFILELIMFTFGVIYLVRKIDVTQAKKFMNLRIIVLLIYLCFSIIQFVLGLIEAIVRESGETVWNVVGYLAGAAIGFVIGLIITLLILLVYFLWSKCDSGAGGSS